jgi:putative superfamily III holin-X
VNTEKSLGVILTETKEELKEFLDTRLQLLKSEIREKLRTWKYAIPLLAVAVALLTAGWAVLTFAIVALLRAWFLPSPYAWLWAGLIVAGVYLISGVAIGWFGYSEIMATGVAPTRTLQVLKQDQVWIQNEARTA